MRHHAHALLRETARIGGRVLERHLVVEARIAGIDHGVVVRAEVQQHGLLQPGVHLPAALERFGDAASAAIERLDGALDGVPRCR